MRMSFDLQMDGMQALQNRTIENAKKVLWLSMHKMEQLAKQYVPVDTGLLRRSINLSPRVEGSKEYQLSASVFYAEDLEYGNTPREVSLGPLIKWVERKGIRTGKGVFSFAKYVQEKIRTKGVNAHPFFRPALLEVETIWLSTYWAQVMARA